MRIAKIVLTILLAAMFLAIGVLFYLRYLIFTPASAQGEAKKFVVSEGEGASTIAEKLEQEEIIKSAFAFKFYAVWKRELSNLQAGTFELSPSMNAAQVLDTISGNEVAESGFTIIEGERLIEVAAGLESRGIVGYGDFMKEVGDGSSLKDKYDFLQSLPKSASLEGFIFPDTYNFSPGMSTDEVIKAALDNFGEKTKSLEAEVKSTKMTWFQVITLASIVEREAGNDADRPKIASIYLNRLKEGMKLEADPTVQYAKGTWDPVTVDDYQSVDSPYNTYLNEGLPPGPICNPGLPSIEAVLSPAKTDYLFFFHLKDGTTIFSKTLDEHDQKKQEYEDRR